MRHDGLIGTWPGLLFSLPLYLWVAHAVVLFTHEYAHAFTAWVLGWKGSPFDLHFPRPSLAFWLIQLGVNQNVNEAPIFASGRGADAAVIALNGMLVGNALITLPLSCLLYGVAKRRASLSLALLAYWITTASIGNLFDYVPIRTFTLESDMGSVQRGFGWSPWTIIVLLGIPTAAILICYLASILPSTLRWAFPESFGKRALLAVVSVLVMFSFYGMAGLLEGGPISHDLSIVSIFVLTPIFIIVEVLAVRHQRRGGLGVE